MARYSKAIAAAVGLALATGVAIWRGDDVGDIPGTAEAITAAIVTFVVWLVPNSE